MLVFSFALSAAIAAPKGSPPTEKQIVTVQSTVVVDQVVNFTITTQVNVVLNYCVEKQLIKNIDTQNAINHGYVYTCTNKDYGSGNINWIIEKYDKISLPPILPFMSAIIT